ncbi:MAG: response regulator [Caldithrix sp.]|nr:response regulator [Caldithrix sp.]
MKLLVLEDNDQLAHDIDQYLTDQGFIVEPVRKLSDARENISLYYYDLVIIDIGLPDGSGLELIQHIKAQQDDTGILVLTAKDTVEQKVEGLNIGADDYMTKPFHKAELNARINSIIRRNKFNRSNWLQQGNIKIDLPASQAYVEDRPLNLTKKEFDLLLYFEI